MARFSRAVQEALFACPEGQREEIVQVLRHGLRPEAVLLDESMLSGDWTSGVHATVDLQIAFSHLDRCEQKLLIEVDKGAKLLELEGEMCCDGTQIAHGFVRAVGRLGRMSGNFSL